MFIPDACYTSYGSFRFADHPAGKIISRERRQKEKRYVQLLSGEPELDVFAASPAPTLESVSDMSRARMLLVCPFAALFIVIWFDHTQPSPSLPMASTGHPSIASLQSASSSGVVGCLNT
jgi:hypothetical protein